LKFLLQTTSGWAWRSERVDSTAPTCNHAIHEFSEPTSTPLQLVALLTARGHWDDVIFNERRLD
jgi:hypothetical protein